LSSNDASVFDGVRDKNEAQSYSSKSAFIIHPITVLIIDDQTIIIEAVRKMLAEEKDIIFHSCSDVNKAMQMANECSPTVILLDLVMPDVDGLTMVKFFRHNPRTRDVPLIVLSGKEEPMLKVEAFALGANDYVVKLPSKLELIARIRYHSSNYNLLLQRNQTYEQLAKLQQEQEKILNRIFPEKIVKELLVNGSVSPRRYEGATVLFIDFVGFTKSCLNVSPRDLLDTLGVYFDKFDQIMGKYHLEKIKTIGDGYMAASGCVPEVKESSADNAINAVSAALEVLQYLRSTHKPGSSQQTLSWTARIGLHTGTVVAGVIGQKRPVYDIWGEAVNIASRMQSYSVPDAINISGTTYQLVKNAFKITDRGVIQVISHGEVEMKCKMYFVEERINKDDSQAKGTQ
jgi:adenylate cyclase